MLRFLRSIGENLKLSREASPRFSSFYHQKCSARSVSHFITLHLSIIFRYDQNSSYTNRSSRALITRTHVYQVEVREKRLFESSLAKCSCFQKHFARKQAILMIGKFHVSNCFPDNRQPLLIALGGL